MEQLKDYHQLTGTHNTQHTICVTALDILFCSKNKSKVLMIMMMLLKKIRRSILHNSVEESRSLYKKAAAIAAAHPPINVLFVCACNSVYVLCPTNDTLRVPHSDRILHSTQQDKTKNIH